MASETQSTPTEYQFQAGIAQLLDILVHSVYTSKDIFIRELISNAADALEKVRFLEVQGTEIVNDDLAHQIKIETEERDDEKVFIITDTGVGMTDDELKENIGTIARSGAAEFLEKMGEAAKKDMSLIGRFGIGFYSVFMAAEKVILTTRSARRDAKPVRWTSDGLGTYTLEILDDPDIPRGTRVEAVLRKGEERFAEKYVIEDAIRKYSNFVPFPIFIENERQNKTKALWREQPSQLKDEEYNEFFHFLTNDSEDPVCRLHTSADSPIQFSALLFVPKTSQEILGFGEQEVSLHLYVKRVLIDAENQDLLPKYLRFVRGVVESEDLPLNISRESLQENRYMIKIRDVLTKRLLDRFAKLAKDDEAGYAAFWTTYGRMLKEGHMDFANAERLNELYRFNSSASESGDELVGLAEYVARMPENQKAVYYLSGSSHDALARDPRLELFRKKGVEVLYLYDLADEFVLNGIGTYQDKPLKSADQVNPDDLSELPDVEADTDAAKTEALDDSEVISLASIFKKILGDRVKDVKSSERLVSSAACLVSEDGASGGMDKLMRIINKDHELPKKTLEINPKHPMIAHLSSIAKADRSDPFLTQAVEQIFEGAMLADGYLSDPHRLVERMQDILTEAAAAKAPKKN